ncbi:MAG: hypothetical protein LBH85_07155, partial [Treponema sp.]|nr:hypothetical protein [Treponema sp.]
MKALFCRILLLLCAASVFAESADEVEVEHDPVFAQDANEVEHDLVFAQDANEVEHDPVYGGRTGLLTITLVILGMLCIVSIAAAGFFAILYFETLKKLKQKDAELPRRTGEREKKAGGSYYDSP